MLKTTALTLLVVLLNSANIHCLFRKVSNGKFMHLGCNDGRALKIEKATYCSLLGCCRDDYVSFAVGALCHGKKSCNFLVTANLFSYRCYKGENLLSIYYTCERCTDSNPLECRVNEEWSFCASTKTCPNPFKLEPDIRPAVCFEGCSCKPGFVLDQRSFLCIPEEFCPKFGDENERFSCCHANRQRICHSPVGRPIDDSSNQCVPGYICKHGFIRNTVTGFCVQDCPKFRG